MSEIDDMSYSIGELRGEMRAMEKRLDKISEILDRMDSRLSRIEDLESQRKGASRMMVFLAGISGSVITLIGEIAFDKIGL